MKKTNLFLIIGAVILAVACSGGGAKESKSNAKTKTVEQIENLNPVKFANEANSIRDNAFEQLEKLLDKHQPISLDFEAEYDALYEATAKEMIKYGEAYAKKEQDVKNQIDIALAAEMGNSSNKTLAIQQKLNARFDEFKEFSGLYNKITKLNIIQKFCHLDDVIKNYPYEAEQFGIK